MLKCIALIILISFLVGIPVMSLCSRFSGIMPDFPLSNSFKPLPVNQSENRKHYKTVQLFYAQDRTDEGCFTLTAVSRKLYEQSIFPEQVLELLFTGPTEFERKQGMSSLFDSQTQNLLQDISMRGDNIYFNLREQPFAVLIERGVLSDCGSMQFLMSLRETLAQILDTPYLLDTFNFCFLIDNRPIVFPRTCD